MAAWTLAEAQQHLAAWKAADLAVASGKEFQLGGRMLRREDADQIAERIRFYSGLVSELEASAALPSSEDASPMRVALAKFR